MEIFEDIENEDIENEKMNKLEKAKKEETNEYIKDYENQYIITSFGRVYSLKNSKYLELKYKKTPKSGMFVRLYKDLKGKWYNVAELIATAFYNYNNTGKLSYDDKNPKLDNLKWVKDYFIYYRTIDDEFKGIISSKPSQIITFDLLPKCYCNFYIRKDYCDDDGIITDEYIHKYYDDFIKSCKELKSKKNKILKIYYTCYSSDYNAVQCTFMRLCDTSYKKHTIINMVERKWIEKCNNAGLTFIKEGIYNSFGYDYKSNYASCMASEDFIIPTKQGEEVILLKLPKKENIKVGYYHVKITSEHKDIKKVFGFSKFNVYTSYSLIFALEHKKDFNIKFEMIQDDEPNAYIYKDSECVSGHYIFSNWFNILSQLRTKYNTNILLKMLGSMLWGLLSQTNTIEVEENELLNNSNKYKDFDIHDKKYYQDGNVKYELLNTKKPYRYQIRIKAFLTAYCRNKIASQAIKSNDLDNIIRIHTDNITFKDNKHDELITYDFLPETKTTGLLKWTKINKQPIPYKN